MSPSHDHSEESPKRLKQEFFKKDSGPAQHMSLRSYITEHIQRQMEGQQASSGRVINESSQFHIQEGPKPDSGFKVTNGDQLYGLDTELSSGIEQLLPTPAVRLRIIKERVTREIASLENHLVQYQAIRNPSPSVLEKISRLENKLATLKYHEQKVNDELTALFSQTSSLFHVATTLQDMKNQLQSGWDGLLHDLSVEKMLHRFSPQREEVDQLNLQLYDLTEILREQMKKRTMSEDEISDVVNEYDRTLKRLDSLTASLQNRKGLWEAMNHQLQETYRKIYS